MLHTSPENQTKDNLSPKLHFCIVSSALSHFLHSPPPETTPSINLLKKNVSGSASGEPNLGYKL